MAGLLRYDLGWGLIFGGAYTWRGLFSEFYGSLSVSCDKISVVILNTDDNEEIKINSEGLADEFFLWKV